MYCNKNTKKCYNQEIQIYLCLYGRTPPCCRYQLYILLKQVDKILLKYNIKYWICFGSLLGAIRDNDIIKIDMDADICIFIKDKYKLLNLADKFYEQGMDFKYYNEYHYRVLTSKINMNFLSIFFYEKDKNDKYICGEFIGDGDWLDKRSFVETDIIELDKARIRNYYFPIPKNSISFLEREYGKEWTIPLHINNFNFIEPDYNKNFQHIPMNSNDPEMKKKWLNIFTRERKKNDKKSI